MLLHILSGFKSLFCIKLTWNLNGKKRWWETGSTGSAKFEKRKQTSGFRERWQWLAKMLNKPPKLKSTVKTKMKSNVNVRPASEAMVCNVADENADALTVSVDSYLRLLPMLTSLIFLSDWAPDAAVYEQSRRGGQGQSFWRKICNDQRASSESSRQGFLKCLPQTRWMVSMQFTTTVYDIATTTHNMNCAC